MPTVGRRMAAGRAGLRRPLPLRETTWVIFSNSFETILK
jgi:hypothetical protein